MWSNIKEAFSVLSWLDLIALAFVVYEIHRHGWPWVKAKFASDVAWVRSEISWLRNRAVDLEHRVKSVENILVQAKIAIPAPDTTAPVQSAQPKS